MHNDGMFIIASYYVLTYGMVIHMYHTACKLGQYYGRCTEKAHASTEAKLTTEERSRSSFPVG